MRRRSPEFVTPSTPTEGAGDAELDASIAYAHALMAARLQHAMRAGEAQGLLARDGGGTEEGRSPVSSRDENRFCDAVHPRTEEVDE